MRDAPHTTRASACHWAQRLSPTLYLLSLLLLLSAGTTPQAQAQDLKIDPANDLFTVAQLSYQTAATAQNASSAKRAFQTTEQWLEKYLKEYPNHKNTAQAYYLHAITQTKLGKKKEALSSYQAVLERQKKGASAGGAALYLGLHAFEKKDYKQAESLFQLATSQLPPTASQAYALYLKARSYEKMNQDIELSQTLDKLLAAPHGKDYHTKAHFLKGELALRKEDYNTALAEFQLCTQNANSPLQAPAIHYCAILAHKLGDTTTSTRYLHQVLKTPSLEKHHPATALLLMSNAATSDSPQQAIALRTYGEKGLTDDQKSKRLLILAQSYEQLGKMTKAKQLYDTLTRTAQGTTTGFEVSYQQIARTPAAQQKEKNLSSFLSTYAQDFSSDNRYESVKLLYGETLFRAEKFRKALAVYQSLKLSQIAPENHQNIAYRICKIHLKGDQPTESYPYINLYVENYPEELSSAYLLCDKGRLQVEHNELKAASETYQSVLNHPKSNVELRKTAWLNLAPLFTEAKDYLKAIGAYETLLLKFTSKSNKEEPAQWCFWLGYNQYKADKYPAAQTNLLKARQALPNWKAAETAQHLALIAFKNKDIPSLRKELLTYENVSQQKLPAPLYLTLALADVKAQQWPAAWDAFQGGIDPYDKASLSTLDPALIEAYTETAVKTQNYKPIIPATQHLKEVTLPPYRKAVNLYRSSLAKYHTSGAQSALSDVEKALLINPAGRLKYELLLLEGKIEMLLGNTANGTRLLKRVYLLGGNENKDLRRNALHFLIQQQTDHPSENSATQLKEYQKELEILQ